MGNYNPHAPYIIGNEWVPIRQADYQPDKVTEQGYTFRIDHSVTPITGAFYVAEVPQTRVSAVSDMIHVYRSGDEDLTGPIKQIHIPVSAIWVTGTEIDASEGYTALNNPSDDNSIRFLGPSDFNSYFGLSFDVPSYSQQLFGKRILDVSFRYSLAAVNASEIENIPVRVSYAKDVFNQGISVMFQQLEGSITGESNKVNIFSLGSTNYMWDATRDISSYFDVYPWRYQELARFAATEPAASRMVLLLMNQLVEDFNAFLYFVDMQVTYCEETRVLYGGRSTTNASVSTFESNYGLGPNPVRLFNTSFVSNSTALAPGNYAVTISHDDWPTAALHGAPKLSALRELYQLNDQRGIRVDKSLTIDETFTSIEVPYLTELTLHTTSAVVTGTHPYGVQDDIPVYGSITALQEIEDDPVGTAMSFPQVRFYARRFGDTNVPLALVDVATGLSTVSISVEDFDVLPEIVDGWREVTLRFAVAPSFATAAGDVDWRWQAPSELARNQWQVLGAGSRAFAAHTIGAASYYAPQGNTVTLTWQSPVISGTADDTLSDATILFSQDPAAVTGFAVSTESQTVTGVVEHCEAVPRCVATEIQYNQLSWPFPPDTGYVLDNFDRTEVDTFGDATIGGPYSFTGALADFDVADPYGTIVPASANADRHAYITVGLNFDATVDVGVVNSTVATSTARGGIIGRRSDSTNYYTSELQTTSTGETTLVITQRVANTPTTLGTVTLTGLTNNAGGMLRLRFMINGDRLKAKAWRPADDQPIGWMIELTSTSLTTGTGVGVFARTATAAGNTLRFANLSITPPAFWFGYYEVQRRDDVTDWQTIMLATSPAVTGFADYEARVGMLSEYRIRQCNVLDFCGSTWVTGAATIPSPGVTVGGDGNSTLIFTSNEAPSSNLSYVMQWEDTPIESFFFPEASEVELQRMFGKNFYTAFHPLERGGEQFTRVILVNAAAIPVPSLANFTGLRDLAWDELNYVCVRDELGNRWFANIRVPDGSARMNRTTYMAQIEVTEVTSTPTPVDPEV